MAHLSLESLITERLCQNEDRFLNLERKLESILLQINDLEVFSSNPIPYQKSLEQFAWRETESFASSKEQLRMLIERQSLRVHEEPQQERAGSILHSSYSPDVPIDRGMQNHDSAYSVGLTLSKSVREDFPVLHEFEHVTDWVVDCENFFEKNRTSDLNRLFLASHYLCDEAKKWYEEIRRKHDLDWKLFKELLLKRFSTEEKTLISTCSMDSCNQDDIAVKNSLDNIALELCDHESDVKTSHDQCDFLLPLTKTLKGSIIDREREEDILLGSEAENMVNMQKPDIYDQRRWNGIQYEWECELQILPEPPWFQSVTRDLFLELNDQLLSNACAISAIYTDFRVCILSSSGFDNICTKLAPWQFAHFSNHLQQGRKIVWDPGGNICVVKQWYGCGWISIHFLNLKGSTYGVYLEATVLLLKDCEGLGRWFASPWFQRFGGSPFSLFRDQLLHCWENLQKMIVPRLVWDPGDLDYEIHEFPDKQLLLKSISLCLELKCRAFTLLSQCYHIMGAIPVQKQVLNKALELASSAGDGHAGKLWLCNFNSQLANCLAVLGEHQSSINAFECGYSCATEICFPELQMYFAASILHVHLMQWESISVVEKAVEKCDKVWNSIPPDQMQTCHGLFFYKELLYTFYRLKICDYKNAAPHVTNLKELVQREQLISELNAEIDAIHENLARTDIVKRERMALYKKKTQIEEQLKQVPAWGDKLNLAPAPIDGEWLPKTALFVLVDLIVVVFDRPKGLFKECGKRIETGLQIIQDELTRLGINNGTSEKDLYRSSIGQVGLYLMLLMHLLESKVALDLTRSEFTETQEALLLMKNWYLRFPTLLPGCDGIIEMLRGQYSHSIGCFSEAAFHFIEATKLTESRSMQTMCNIYAALSLICVGDADSSSHALDLIGPICKVMDSFAGVREKTGAIFVYGLILMRQDNLQDARTRLAYGLRITHQLLGNIQLVSQYLTVLGSLALALHDTAQAREILKSALTLAKTLHDIPTQKWVLSVLTALYQELGENANEMENTEYEKRKTEELQKRLSDALSSVNHLELIEKVRIEASGSNDFDKKVTAGPSTKPDLDIPESVGLYNIAPPQFSSRLSNFDSKRITRSRRRT